jgi:hypothetical protein
MAATALLQLEACDRGTVIGGMLTWTGGPDSLFGIFASSMQSFVVVYVGNMIAVHHFDHGPSENTHPHD